MHPQNYANLFCYGLMVIKFYTHIPGSLHWRFNTTMPQSQRSGFVDHMNMLRTVDITTTKVNTKHHLHISWGRVQPSTNLWLYTYAAFHVTPGKLFVNIMQWRHYVSSLIWLLKNKAYIPPSGPNRTIVYLYCNFQMGQANLELLHSQLTLVWRRNNTSIIQPAASRFRGYF